MADTTVRARLPESFRDPRIKAAVARIQSAKSNPLTSAFAQELGRKQFLSDREAAALIVRVMPPLGLDPSALVWLSAKSSSLRRLLADESARKLVFPCTPQELSRWANRIDVVLPAAFVRAIHVPARKRRPLLPGGIDPEIQRKAIEIARRLKNPTKTKIVDELKPLYPRLALRTLERRFNLPSD